MVVVVVGVCVMCLEAYDIWRRGVFFERPVVFDIIGIVPGISPLDGVWYRMRAFAGLGVLYFASLKAVKAVNVKEGKKEVLYVILDDTRGGEKKRKEKKKAIQLCISYNKRFQKLFSCHRGGGAYCARKIAKILFQKKSFWLATLT